MDLEKYMKNFSCAGPKEDHENLIYIGSSKFDKLRRISLIKPIADAIEIEEGDEINYYTDGKYIILEKNDKLIWHKQPWISTNDETAEKIFTLLSKIVKINETKDRSLINEEITKVLKESNLTKEELNEMEILLKTIKVMKDEQTKFDSE